MTESAGECGPASNRPQLVVYYDGACPRCRRDRRHYERLAGTAAEQVEWFDITGQGAELEAMGIDPDLALTELHVSDAKGQLYRGLEAYRLLMNRVGRLRPLAWLIGLPVIRPLLSRLYRHWVRRRLIREGRLP